MKLCSIVPTNKKKLMLGRDYNMLLSHIILDNPKYAKWVKNNLKDSYKIVDNSIVELGEAFNMEDLLRAANEVDANEIILPDVFRDGESTIEKAKESIVMLKNSKYWGRFKLMAVCHARSKEEFEKNFKELEKIEEINVIGIPKVTSEWGNRNDFKELYLNSNKEIHYLGCYDSFRELIEIVNDEDVYNKIRTIDTCLPSLLCIQDKKWYEKRNRSYTIDLQRDKFRNDDYENMMKDLKENLGL